MKVAVLALLLAACGGGESITAPATATLSMEQSAWTFRYSPGMPEHPTAALGGGWQFDFPAQDGVHYLTTPLTTDLRGKTVKVQTQIVGDATYAWPADNCPTPARARVMVERQGDDLRSAVGRWWADAPIDLKAGTAEINVPVAVERWTNVEGQRGGFDDAMQHTGFIGLTFGGGCFFGHGVWLQGGTARMLIKAFTIQ